MRPTKKAVQAIVVAIALILSRVSTQGQIGGIPPVTPPPVAPPPAPNLALAAAKLDPVLQQQGALLSGSTNVVVMAHDAASLAAVSTAIQSVGGTLGRLLPIINACAATIPNPQVLTVAANAAVQHISIDRLILGANGRTGMTVGSTAVRETMGLDGAGIGVAVIDSGITGWHDDLGGGAQSSQRVDRFVDFVNNQAVPYDDFGHGTHVAGVIAGNGYDTSGARAGIAPAAHLVVLKVLDGSGHGRISDVIAALDYVATHAVELNIRVVNLSVGAAVTESFDTDPLAQAAKRVVEHGVVVVAAAGNAGRTPQGRALYGGIAAPGNAPWVLTVGASSTMGTIDRSDDTIASFSSRGPTFVDRRAKPDLVAPGVGIESLSAPESSMYSTKSQYLLSGTVATPTLPYLSLSGTSQAAPVIAGTVALMLQANPSLTPNLVKAILQYTAEFAADNDPLTQGAGFLNAYGAVELARYLGAPFDWPYPATDGWSRHVIWGNTRVFGGDLWAGATAWNLNVEWGRATTSAGDAVTWGLICVSACSDDPVWDLWSAQYGSSNNVVWASNCGGGDCPSGQAWNPNQPSQGTQSTDPNTVVWGTAEYETVVWGTSENETVVWGTSENETVVWGTNCDDPSCEPVVWP